MAILLASDYIAYQNVNLNLCRKSKITQLNELLVNDKEKIQS